MHIGRQMRAPDQLQRRRSAAEMELIDGRKIVDMQGVRVFASSAQPAEYPLAQIARRVVRTYGLDVRLIGHCFSFTPRALLGERDAAFNPVEDCLRIVRLRVVLGGGYLNT